MTSISNYEKRRVTQVHLDAIAKRHAMNKPKKKNLVELIKDNPECKAVIDNDSWVLSKNDEPPKDFDNWTEDAQEKWHKEQELACSDDDIVQLGDGGYGSGNCYGGDILQALAEIAGIVIESV